MVIIDINIKYRIKNYIKKIITQKLSTVFGDFLLLKSRMKTKESYNQNKNSLTIYQLYSMQNI